MLHLQKTSFYFLIIICTLQLFGCKHFSNTSRASRYIARGKTNQAIAILTKEISKQPNNYLAYFYRGVAYSQLNDNKKAIANYSKSIEINPDYYYAYFNRSISYRDIKKYKLAIDDINKVVSLNPKMYLAYVHRGTLYHNLQENQKAISSYDKALSLQPKGLYALLFKANLLYDMQNYKVAMHYYNILTNLYSQKSPIVCNAAAWKLTMCPEKKYRNINIAFSLAKKAYHMFPSFVTCDTLAAVYARKKDFTNAIKYQQDAIKLALKEHGNNENEFVPDLNERLESYKRKISWEEGAGKRRKGVITQGGVIRL